MSDKQPIGVDDQQIIAEKPTADSQSDIEQQKAVQDFTKSGGKASMQVRVQSPFRSYYDGQAFSLSAENATGPFDILPRHHNFISLLQPCDVVVRTVKDTDRRIRISGGIIHVKADQVIVFLDV